MMVAFRYDNDAVGSLYYSREIPSLFRGLRLSKLFGRERHHHVRVERRVRRSCAARGCRGCSSRASATSAAIRRCIATSSRAIRERPRAGDEPRARDRRSAADGSDLRQRSRPLAIARCRRERYDIVIIGSGAGGGTMAQALADTAARILVLERGDFVPQEARELESGGGLEAPALPDDRALARRARAASSCPYTHYSVGGNTKFWGSVLYRLRREDFQAIEHVDGVSPAWPIDYDTLAPYYERAERLYHVHGAARRRSRPSRRAGRFRYAPVPHAAGMAAIVERAARAGPASVAAAARPAPPARPAAASSATPATRSPASIHAKSDAEVCGVRPALARAERHAVDQRAARGG